MQYDLLWFIITDRHPPQISATDFLHLIPYKMHWKNCCFCSLQRSAEWHISRKMILLSAHSFPIPDISLLPWMDGTMLPSCPIIPCDRHNWLLTPQLVTSSTKSQREVAKTVRLFCIPGTTHFFTEELDHGSPRVEVPPVPWLCSVGSASATEKLLAYSSAKVIVVLMGLWILLLFIHSTSVFFDDTQQPQKTRHRAAISLRQVARDTSWSQRLNHRLILHMVFQDTTMHQLLETSSSNNGLHN